MSKERLEEIRNRMIVEKQHFKYLNSEKGYWENVYTLLEQDMKYLFDTIIEQAEQKKALETTVDFYQSALRDADRRVQELEDRYSKVLGRALDFQEQNKRYREAIEDMLKNARHKGMVILIGKSALEGEE